MANILTRLFGGGGQIMPKVKPKVEMGVSGTAVFGGFVQRLEKSSKWNGTQRYTTSQDIVVNTSIVAAGLHHFLNLVAHPEWSVVPTDEEDKKAVEMADFVQEVIDELKTPWPRIVRRAGMYRFHGFGIQEWTAIKREDGKIGFKDIEPRPQFTIEQWEIDDTGNILGCFQRSPQTGQLLPLPRGKLVYLVDDTITDSPEGLGLFRHLAEPYERLKRYYELETRGYERDLRGTPIGRAPLSKIKQDLKDGKITEAEYRALVEGMEAFVQTQVKGSQTGMVLDSQPFENPSSDGFKVAGVPQWNLELLAGGVSGLGELDQAINRLQREMARILGVEHLMMGDQGGNRAMSEDKSRNLYLIANSVLANIATAFEQDLIGPLWDLNGFDEDLKPKLQTEDVAFKDAMEVAQTLAQMASAGAVMAPDDEAINDVRDLLGINRAPEPSEEMLGAVYTPKEQQLDFEQKTMEAGLGQKPDEYLGGVAQRQGGKEFPKKTKKVIGKGHSKFRKLRKYDPNQPRHAAGTEEGGQWSGGGGSTSSKSDDKGPMDLASAQEAVRAYTRSSSTVNRSLRGNKDTPSFLQAATAEDDAAAKEVAANLDRVFSNASYPESTQVYRGVRSDYWTAMLKNVVAGKGTFTDNGFLSTSLSRSVASKFAGKGGGVIRIVLPKGSSAISVGDMSQHGDEQEVLVNRGTKMRVRDVDPQGRVITVELVR